MVADNQRFDRHATAWLIFAIACIAGFVLLTGIVASRVPIPFDQPLLNVAGQWSNLKDVWVLFSYAGNLPFIPIGLGFVVWLWWKGRHREAMLVLAILIAATIVTEGLKVLIAKPRPTTGGPAENLIPGTEFSYPSGHSFEDVMILGMIGLRIWRHATSNVIRWLYVILATAFVIAVEIARVAIASHWPSDMLAGLLGGFAAIGLYGWFARRGGWADEQAPPKSAGSKPAGSKPAPG